MKRIIKDYLYFSKQERIAVLVLLVLMGSFIAMPYLYKPKAAVPVINQALLDWLAGNDSSVIVAGTGQPALPVQPAVTLFPFDPNTVSEEDWLRLGVPAKTARTIDNYRNKGGRFRQPEDIRKIWGMPGATADRLIPYIRISGKTSFPVLPETARHHPTVRKMPAPININTAGAAEWASLPGIGDVLSQRIVRYRDKLGGFRSVQQVARTYGISDSLFTAILPYLRYQEEALPKLNINTASVYMLRQAGLDYRLATGLVRYREQNGPYQSMEGLHKLIDIPDSSWQKLILLIKVE
jgi:competence protein ComEA